MSGPGGAAHERPGAPLRVLAGGEPTPHQLAALATAVATVLEAEAVVAPDPLPAAYRSRWRRAAMIEASEVPTHVKHDGTPWGVH